MHRRIQLLAIVLTLFALVKPFDCLALTFTPKAADCCLKGHCTPTANGDECCQNNVPGGDHYLAASVVKHAIAEAPVAAFSPGSSELLPSYDELRGPVEHPPPPASISDALPLLI